ncbi:MAG TPA: response regulator [Anaeromyxobacteraceae bacterium]|nr:response regulator [Anaeromyxobacteraceae bacterium]
MESSAPAGPTPASISQKRVLVVEDHKDMREALAEVLALEGYHVSAVPDGEKALREARRLLPDVILLDLMMPVMNGLQFRAEQLRDPLLAAVPVIVMSAFDIEVTAAARLSKPFQIDDMLETVHRLAA